MSIYAETTPTGEVRWTGFGNKTPRYEYRVKIYGVPAVFDSPVPPPAQSVTIWALDDDDAEKEAKEVLYRVQRAIARSEERHARTRTVTLEEDK